MDTHNSVTSSGLQALAAEVNSLAIQFKRFTATLHQQDRITAVERALMQLLSSVGPLSVPQLSRQRRTSRQNVQIVVNRLRVQGWVDLTTNEAHKKSALVRLTQEGEDVLGRALDRESTVRSSFESRFSPARLDAAIRILTEVRLFLVAEIPGSARKQPRPKSPADRKVTTPSKVPRPVPEPQTEEMPLSLL